MNDEIYNFRVGELIKILQQYPEDMPVVVSGQDNGYDNFFHPYVRKVIYKPENIFRDGQFQINDDGTDVLLLRREERYD